MSNDANMNTPSQANNIMLYVIELFELKESRKLGTQSCLRTVHTSASCENLGLHLSIFTMLNHVACRFKSTINQSGGLNAKASVLGKES